LARRVKAKTRPLLKWAGGKAQLLPTIGRYVPARWNRYVEPMIGGGALFFALAPPKALVADANPELINFYRSVVEDLDGLIAQYEQWPFDERTYYELRALRYDDLDSTTAAARMLYLNRACFNGLYRVNRRGEFNVPWGRYKRPYVIERDRFEAARDVLRCARIELGDFAAVLTVEAMEGDFVFLDPPYVPVSTHSDFKRYTRQQFYADDHVRMAHLVRELSSRGCEIIVTNSNQSLVHDLYQGYQVDVIPTRRNVNSRPDGRTGEDVVIHVPPAR
jgi:DNA adenine methylase